MALVGRRSGLLDQVAADITRSGGKALALSFDLGEPGASKAVVERTVATFGGVEALVNNAAVTQGSSVGRLHPRHS